MIKLSTKKFQLSLVAMLFSANQILAQTNITAIENQVQDWGDAVITVLTVATASIALIFAIMVAWKYMSGSQDAGKHLGKVFIGLVIVALFRLVIPIFLN